MTVTNDAFRKFQEELAALDRKTHLSPPPSLALEKPTPEKPLSREARLEHAKADFLLIKKRYGLSVADVIAFFPEEDGIAYLQELIAANEAKPVRRKKIKEP